MEKHSRTEFKTLLKCVDNRHSGFREDAGGLERLKWEVEVACDNFWRNPKAPVDRPKTDPGAGGPAGFKRLIFGKG